MANDDCKLGVRLSKSRTCQERYIKVHEIHYGYRLKEQPSSAGDRPVPWLQMRGHWLRDAGFEIHTPVKVRVMDGCLVLTIENPRGEP